MSFQYGPSATKDIWQAASRASLQSQPAMEQVSKRDLVKHIRFIALDTITIDYIRMYIYNI